MMNSAHRYLFFLNSLLKGTYPCAYSLVSYTSTYPGSDHTLAKLRMDKFGQNIENIFVLQTFSFMSGTGMPNKITDKNG